MEIPRKIYAYWHAGEDAAPPLVRMCLDRWRRLNPAFTLQVLTARDADVALRGVPICYCTMSVQAFTDVLRTKLLQEGGVWIDATVFPTQALTEWIDGVDGNGTVFFRSPGANREMSSWFIAAERGSPLMKGLWTEIVRYWQPQGRLCRGLESSFLASGDRSLMTRAKRQIVRRLGPHRLPQSDVFFSISDDMKARDPRLLSIVDAEAEARWKGAYPYFWFHFIFNALVARDASIREYWAGCPALSADAAHGVQRRLIDDPGCSLEDLVSLARLAPVQKLKWQSDFPWQRCLELDRAL